MHYREALRIFDPPIRKIRLGKDNDGGYVVCDLSEYDVFLSAGVSNDTSFEEAVLARHPGLRCTAYDGTIAGLPHPVDRLKLIKRNIDAHTNWHGDLARCRDALVKMDIEGAEYAWLADLDANRRSHIKQLVIEWHDVPDHLDEIAHMAETHWLVHLHANNWGKVTAGCPQVVEATYIRRDLCDDLPVSADPVPGPLDQPNRADRPDIGIHFAPRTIVCLTTHPGRNGTVQPTIDSLHAQTRKPDEIRLYHGPGCEDLPTGCTLIPTRDVGPLTKLSAAVDPALAEDDLIVTVDDDVIYHPGCLAKLCAAAEAAPDEACGFAGWNTGTLVEGKGYTFVQPPHLCDVIEGFAGAAYRRGFFGSDVLDSPPEFRNVDDVWISGYLAQRGVPRRVIARKMCTPCDGGTGLHYDPNFVATNRRAAALAFAPRRAKLSICIASLQSRSADLAALLAALQAQPRIREVEILISIDERHETVCDKRNRLLQQASGRYICTFDDDDLPSPRYLEAILTAIDSNPGVDAIVFRGVCTRDDGGAPPQLFDYAIGIDGAVHRDGVLWRTPCHLTPIRADIAKSVPFPDVRHGEDTALVEAIAPHIRTAARAGAEGEVLYHYHLDAQKEQRPAMSTDHKAIFTRQYSDASGPGSLPEFTAPYRAWLEAFCRKHKVKSVVDMPCGDMQIGGSVKWPKGCTYLGVDIIEDRISRNREAFPDLRFECADLTEWTPPDADLLIVKDCLQHWPTADVLRWLDRLKTAKFKFCLVTNCAYGPTLNTDTKVGGWRALDLSQPPFSVGEVVYEWGPDNHHKRVVLLRGAAWHGDRAFAPPEVRHVVAPAPAIATAARDAQTLTPARTPAPPPPPVQSAGPVRHQRIFPCPTHR